MTIDVHSYDGSNNRVQQLATNPGGGYDGHVYAGREQFFGEHHNRVDFSAVETFKATLGSGADNFVSGDGNDTIVSGAGDDSVLTGSGADDVDGGKSTDLTRGADRWQGDKSAATVGMTLDLTAASSTYVINGLTATITEVEALGVGIGAGQFFQSGGGGDRIVTTGDFLSDYVMTNGGADSVKIAGGRDVIDTGSGSDLLEIDWSDMTIDVHSYDGSNNRVQQLATNPGGGYDGHVYAGREQAFGEHHNRVDFSAVETFKATLGSAGDDFVTGAGADTVLGMGGDDTLYTDEGADVIDGGAGADRWVANKAATMVLNLTLNGVQGTYAGTGSVSRIEMLSLTTGAGDDQITTRSQFYDDTVSTGLGADMVKIAGGRDVIDLGGQAAGTTDLLVIDWFSMTEDVHSYDGGNSRIEQLAANLAGGWDGHVYTARQQFFGETNHNRVDFAGVERFDVTLGSGADTFVTGDGADTVRSGAGFDTLITGGGADVIDGGREADLTRGADRWQADKSAATVGMNLDLTAASTSYTIGGITATVTQIEALGLGPLDGRWFQSGSGGDNITTTADFLEDYIHTNGGADTVKVSGGRDNIDFGTGLDTLIVDWGTITEDMRTYAWSGSLASGYTGEVHSTREQAFGETNHNRIDFVGVEKFDVLLGSGADAFQTGDRDDTISGGAGDDTLTTGRGSDIVNGGAGVDRWVADKSNATAAEAIVLDLTKGGVQGTYLSAGRIVGIESLTLTTGAGDDDIVTRAEGYGDTVNTGHGSDSVEIAGGRDRIDLGDEARGAADTLVIDWSAIGLDFNTYDFAEGANGYDGTVYSTRERAFGEQHDRVDYFGVERFDVKLGSGSDHFVAGDGDDRLSGGDGGDILTSGRGVDTIDGGLGDDRWEADKANIADDIVINLQKTTPQFYATTGSIRGIEMLTLTTGGGNDKITTGAGFDDQVTTRSGNDQVTVAGGRDSIALGNSGAGGDRLIVDWTAFGDDIRSTALADDGAGFSGSFLTTREIAFGEHHERVDFSGVDRLKVLLGGGSDSLSGALGADTIDGGAGNDTLSGADGKDKLFGGDNTDVLTGDEGDDLLLGGLGADNLTGGLGADLFSYSSLADSQTGAADLITDLEDIDRIDLRKVDANSLVDGDQKFVKVVAFTHHAGQLVRTYDAATDRTLIQGDVDGDGVADFTITAVGDHHTFTHFVL
jgi:Ca2+-binding RTX toxin-like protein